MRRNLLCATIAAALAVLVTPSAQAWTDAWAGSACDMASTNDRTGQLIQDPNTWTGEIHGGPVAVVNETGGTIRDVSVTCTVKINYGINDYTNVAASRSSTTSGNVGVLADTITYTALPGDDVYLCTDIHWCGSKGCTWIYLDDDDDATNGVQCALLPSVEVR